MAAKNTALHNLTLASAKHLMQQGHISPGKHAAIVKKVRKPKAPAMAPMQAMADEAPPAAFGSLDPMMGAGAGHYMGTMPEEN